MAGESITLLFTRNTAGTLALSNFVTGALDSGYLYAAHVGGIGDVNDGFRTVGAQVPEPGSLWLLGSAAGLLVVIKRHRAKKSPEA